MELTNMSGGVTRIADLPYGRYARLQVVNDGIDWLVSLFNAKNQCVTQMKFLNVVSIRYGDLEHLQGVAGESYESLVRINNSPWVKEVLARRHPDKFYFPVAHFTFLASDYGYFEFLCENTELEIDPLVENHA